MFWGGVTYIESEPRKTPGQGVRRKPDRPQKKAMPMKVTVEMDMTPQEARAFMGLPDVEPMQKKMLDDMQGRLKQAFDANDPEAMMRAWMPLGGAEAFQKFQKLMWDSAAGMVKKDGK